MACHAPRPRRRGSGAPLGAVLEGGYHVESLVESVLATMRALGGEGESVSIAPEEILTSRAATHVAPYWSL